MLIRTPKQNPNEGRVTLFCGEHQYFGPLAPMNGCKGCWQVYYMNLIASFPENERQAKLEELEAIVHHATELAEKGKWDFKPYRHPEIEIEKDVS